MSDAPVNFIPDDYLEKKSQNRSNLICIGLFFVVMAGIGAAVLFNMRQFSQLQSREDIVSKQLLSRAHELDRINALKIQKRQMVQKARIVAALWERMQRSMLVYDVVKLMPGGVSLQQLQLTTKMIKVKLTPLQKAKRALERKTHKKVKPRIMLRRVTLRITGLASTADKVATFYAELNHCGLFNNVTPLYTEEYKDKHDMVQRFGVRMTLKPHAKFRAATAKQRLAMAGGA